MPAKNFDITAMFKDKSDILKKPLILMNRKNILNIELEIQILDITFERGKKERQQAPDDQQF